MSDEKRIDDSKLEDISGGVQQIINLDDGDSSSTPGDGSISGNPDRPGQGGSGVGSQTEDTTGDTDSSSSVG